jgi:hypothetical protein
MVHYHWIQDGISSKTFQIKGRRIIYQMSQPFHIIKHALSTTLNISVQFQIAKSRNLNSLSRYQGDGRPGAIARRTHPNLGAHIGCFEKCGANSPA